jgi:hypothetical protein
LLGHLVIYDHLLMVKKDLVGAAHEFWALRKASLEESDREGCAESILSGTMEGYLAIAVERHWEGLLDAGRPFEACRLKLAGNYGGLYSGDRSLYNPARAAALAGTGQGLDPPPPAERPAIRKHALEWLTSSLKDWQQHATALPVLAARSVSLAGSPFGGGPLLSVCCLPPETTDLSAERAEDREVVHKRMNEWLQDADLARVRDDPWLAKLPAEEREQWQRLWKEARSLRDGTSAPKP